MGASVQSLYELGKKKGYELIHVMRTGPNVIFVDEIYFDRFGIATECGFGRRPAETIPELLRIHAEAADL